MPRFIPAAVLALALVGASVAAPAVLPGERPRGNRRRRGLRGRPSAGRTRGRRDRAGEPAAPTAVAGAIKAKYQTKASTTLYSTATGTKKVSTVPADYTVATRTAKKSSSGKRIQVEYKSKTGWITLSKTSKVSLSTKVGQLSWKASAAKNIARWCSGVPIDTSINYMNQATAQVSTSNGKRKVTEKINLSTKTSWGTALDPNHPMAISIQYHECGHIMQYRAYNYDFAALGRAMNKVYGTSGNTAGGVEHMADCISEALGPNARAPNPRATAPPGPGSPATAASAPRRTWPRPRRSSPAKRSSGRIRHGT